jgi:hypothetical protein
MFNKEYFVKRFNDLSSTLQREENGYPVEKEFYVTGGDIEITFLDPYRKPTNSPSHTQYWELKMRDINPGLIRGFQFMNEFNHDGGINIVKVKMFIQKDFDESKYDDLFLDETKLNF